MISHAFSWLFMFVSLRLLLKDRLTIYFAEVGAFFWFGEVMDELFFNPIEVQFNEIVVLIISLVYLSFRIGKLTKK